MDAERARVLETLTGPSIAEFLGFWLSHDVLGGKEQETFDYYYRSYKKHFGPYLRHYYERQTRELMVLLRAGHPSLLEVGCGCGTEALWAAVHGADVTGIDISPDLLSAAGRRLEWLERQIGKQLRCRFVHRSVLDVEESRPFDIVYLEQAFHHLEPRERVVDKLVRLVRSGGHLVISESNGWNPFLQLALLKLRGTRTIISHEGHAWGHERITVPWAVIRQFKRRRLKPVTLAYYRTLPNLGIADRLLPLDRRMPPFARPLFTHFNLVLRKDGD